MEGVKGNRYRTWCSDGKEPACNAGVLGSILGSGMSTGEVNGYPHQYSCMENPMERGAWRATVLGVAKIQAPLRDKHAYNY